MGKRQETIGYADSDKPTVLYVFSPSCVWCERNTQNINLIADLKRESFRFIGLSLSDDGLQDYVGSHHFNFPVYAGVTPESAQMLGLGSTPQTIVISPDGRIQQNWVGAYASSIRPQVEGFFNVRLPGLTAPKK
jgi:peroxiredoxin